MKIALPTRDGVIDDHFGHCDHYTIFDVSGGKIQGTETMVSPEGCGCKSDIAPILAKKGVIIMLAGNMGEGAKNVLNANGIKVIRGCKGPIQQVIETYLAGSITDSGIPCDDHNCENDQ